MYPLNGFDVLALDGAVLPFADGHTRQPPRLAGGRFRYGTYAVSYLAKAQSLTSKPVKQPVIAPSALSLLYRADGLLAVGGSDVLDLARPRRDRRVHGVLVGRC